MSFSVQAKPVDFLDAFKIFFKSKRVKNGGKRKVTVFTGKAICKLCRQSTAVEGKHKSDLREQLESWARAHIEHCESKNLNPQVPYVR